ncbi:MAG: hypothetical protein K2O24_04425 [Muribaculaceae bacterium]|nr:hypothetical protein [Muribaculaceae bacterium]
MKRIMLFLVGLWMAFGAVAQNANRSGFFVEAGAGGFFGKTPRTSIMYDSKTYTYTVTFANSCALDLGFGFRARLGRHWAYQCRLQLEADAANFNPLFSPKVFPLGFRYTSPEIFGNSSIYASVDLGLSSWPSGNPNIYYYPEKTEDKKQVLGATMNIDGYGNIICGIIGSAGVGINITTKLYAGFSLEVQRNVTTTALYRIGRIDNMFWGSVGVRVGYRF